MNGIRIEKLILAISVCVLGIGIASAQTAARILVGYPPGGHTDAIARIVAEKLTEATGRTFVVETRTGASGQIAAQALKASPPDGTSLLVQPDSAITLYPHTVRTPVYDTLNDFVGVAHVGGSDIGLAVGPNVPAKDLAEWLAWVKADRKNAVYGSPGAGTNMHFLGLVLAQSAGVQLVHVPYRGSGPAVADLLGGQVPALLLPLNQLTVQAKAGKVRVLAHTGTKRNAQAPEIPTFRELGYPSMERSSWYLVLAPAGIRPDVLARYNEIIVHAQRTPAVRERMRVLDLETREMTPAEIAATLKAEHDRWAPTVKASGFSADSQ
jgi:tripartite-type tricarboxylate transporter receptor subunit TctC